MPSARSRRAAAAEGRHDIDVIHWLAGGCTRRVSGMGDLVYGDITDRRSSDRLMWDWFGADTWPPTAQKNEPDHRRRGHLLIQMRLDNGVLASTIVPLPPDASQLHRDR